MFASFADEYVDLRPHPTHQSLHPEKAIGYPVGNALAEAARARGLSGIILSFSPHGRHLPCSVVSARGPIGGTGNVYRMIWLNLNRSSRSSRGRASRGAARRLRVAFLGMAEPRADSFLTSKRDDLMG